MVAFEDEGGAVAVGVEMEGGNALGWCIVSVLCGNSIVFVALGMVVFGGKAVSSE